SKSTSAAVELIEIPTGSTKPAQETASYCSALEKSGKTLAKFKQTDNVFTTTSTAADLGYYHLSRVLGDICEIKPAVLRTMDIEQHKRVVKLAADMGIHGTVGKSWDLFNKYYANPAGSSVAQSLFTSDFTQIYGALIENTTGEENYAAWLSVGTDLSSTQAFRRMADARPLKAILGSTQFSQENVQTLVGMRDMSEMILIDYLMAQSDRLSGGNISDYNFVYFIDGDDVKSVNAHKADSVPANAVKVTVKKLTLKDNDAGLLNNNLFEQKGYISQISHMHPDTYNRLIAFAQKWKEDPTVKEFFHKECTLSASQLARFEKYILTAANTLESRKANGKLLLDLDLDDYFRPTASSSATPQEAETTAGSDNVASTSVAVISGSVGRWEKGAGNLQGDVETVQRLLQAAAQRLQAPPIDPKGVDGKIARPPATSNTVAAIEAFQSRSNISIDGLIDPTSQTWQALLQAAVGT
ncbi:MAG: peptidoglycan-binding domain-containing protein, partial [Candidatus Udaeobacter sp.]